MHNLSLSSIVRGGMPVGFAFDTAENEFEFTVFPDGKVDEITKNGDATATADEILEIEMALENESLALEIEKAYKTLARD